MLYNRHIYRVSTFVGALPALSFLAAGAILADQTASLALKVLYGGISTGASGLIIAGSVVDYINRSHHYMGYYLLQKYMPTHGLREHFRISLELMLEERDQAILQRRTTS